MDEDNPDYLVHEIFTQNFWKDHPLGKPILGTKETVRSFEREMLLDYYGQALRARKHDHRAAGNLNHDASCDLVTRVVPSTCHAARNGFHEPAAEDLCSRIVHAQQEVA